MLLLFLEEFLQLLFPISFGPIGSFHYHLLRSLQFSVSVELEKNKGIQIWSKEFREITIAEVAHRKEQALNPLGARVLILHPEASPFSPSHFSILEYSPALNRSTKYGIQTWHKLKKFGMNKVNGNSTPHFFNDWRSEKLGLIKEVKSFSPVEPYFSFQKQLCWRMSNNEEPYLLKVEVCLCYYPSMKWHWHPQQMRHLVHGFPTPGVKEEVHQMQPSTPIWSLIPVSEIHNKIPSISNLVNRISRGTHL